MKMSAVALLSAAALVFPALADAGEYTIDPAHTHVGFTINHLGFSDVFGQFNNVSGVLTLDEKAPEKSKIEVVIDPASIYTANDTRDEHLKGPEFFDVKKFPTLTFKSTRVEVTGKNTANVTGDLTMHGITKPVDLVVRLNKAGPSPLDKSRQVAGFSALGKLKRSDFGIKTYVPMIGDEVTLTISTETILK